LVKYDQVLLSSGTATSGTRHASLAFAVGAIHAHLPLSLVKFLICVYHHFDLCLQASTDQRAIRVNQLVVDFYLAGEVIGIHNSDLRVFRLTQHNRRKRRQTSTPIFNPQTAALFVRSRLRLLVEIQATGIG
jgi:hypothetical protein